MRATGKLVVALAGWCGAAAAHATDCEPAGWTRIPTAAELSAAYPPAARAAGIDGRAVLACRSLPDGRMVDCSIRSETPEGQGFGAAALTLVERVRGTRPCPGSPALAPGGATVPIRFTAAAPEPPLRPARFQTMSAYRRLGDAGPYYPDRAARVGATAMVLMDCRVGEGGRLTGCEVVEVTNPDFGFEFAALKMAERGWMTAGAAPEGVTAGANDVWRFRVIFDASRR